MTITSEQFDKLLIQVIANTEDIKELKGNVSEIKGDVKKILNSVDGIANNYKNHEIEHTSNIATHDRFQQDIDKIKTHIKIPATV